MKFADFFDSYTIQVATDLDILTNAYKLRHTIHCVENNFQPRTLCGLDRDRYDAEAQHIVIQHGTDVIAYMRVLLGSEQHLLPFQHHCVTALNAKNSSLTEWSRMAIAQGYRCQRILPTALFFAALAVSIKCDRKYVYGLLEPKLAKLVELCTGTPLIQLGPVVDYGGPCATYGASSKDLLWGIRLKQREGFLRGIRNELYEAKPKRVKERVLSPLPRNSLEARQGP